MSIKTGRRIKEADKQAKSLIAEIVPLCNEVESAAVDDVVSHVSNVLEGEEKKVETERRTRKIAQTKPKEATQP